MGMFLDIISIAISVIIILNVTSGNLSREVPAEDIVSMLANNDAIVNYNDTIINGNLTLERLPKSDFISSKIYINNSIINGTVDLQRITFDKEIIFYNVTFNQIVDFRGSCFNDNTTFLDCTFKNISIYDRCNFKKLSCFRKAEFWENAFFDGSKFQELNAKNIHFHKLANFKNSNFNSSIDMVGGKFFEADFTQSLLHNSNFVGARFNTGAFSHTIFIGSTSFRGAKIDEGYFGGSEFKGVADFGNANISNIIYFYNSIFRGDFLFGGSYAKGVFFKDSQFQGDAQFQERTFQEVANFANSKFSKLADFQGAKFGNDTIFSGTEFGKDGGSANFKEASFASNISFSDSIFNNDAYFTKANFSGNQTSFENVDFREDAFFEDVKIKGAISLAKAKYNDLYLRYKDIAGKLDFDEEAYLRLIKNFNDQALFYDADKLYYEYRTQYRTKGWDSSSDNENPNLSLVNIAPWVITKSDEPFKKFIDTILDFSYAYGTEPIRPFYFSLIIIIAYAALWRGIGYRKKFYVTKFQSSDGETSADNFVRTIINEINREKDSLVFSILLFLSGTRLFVDPPKLPGFPANSSRLASIMYFSERILGALFLALLLISISKTIIRSPTNLI
jgi:uncharacterized protein YjbI with pentapeptide repeats